MAIVFASTLIAGFSYQPDDSPLQPFSDNGLLIELPREMVNSTDTFPLTLVSWSEAHGEEIPGLGSTIPFLKLPPPTKDTTRILLMVGYAIENFAAGTQWNARFDLPDGAEFKDCKTMPGLTCGPIESNVPEGQGRSKRLIEIKGTLAAEHSTPSARSTISNTNGFLVQMDITGVPGMLFSRSRTKTLVRYPTVVLAPYSPEDPLDGDDVHPLAVTARVCFDRASTIAWSERAAGSGNPDGIDAPVRVNGKIDEGQLGDSSQWAYFMDNDMPVTMPSITGTDNELVESDSNDLFLAGVWFGIAGGCFVTIVQLIVVGWPKRKPDNKNASAG